MVRSSPKKYTAHPWAMTKPPLKFRVDRSMCCLVIVGEWKAPNLANYPAEPTSLRSASIMSTLKISKRFRTPVKRYLLTDNFNTYFYDSARKRGDLSLLN